MSNQAASPAQGTATTVPADVMTAFDHVLRQVERAADADPARLPATQVYDQLDVPAFLEVQAQAMRNNGFFDATVSHDGPIASLSWTPNRDVAAGGTLATFTLRAVDGDVRPFRAEFLLPGVNVDSTSVGVSSHHLDVKLLSRWFAVFVDQAMTASAVRMERAAQGGRHAQVSQAA